MSSGGRTGPPDRSLPDETLRARTVRAMTSAIRGDAGVWGHLRELLNAAGKRMPVSVALERLAAMLEGAIDAVLLEAIEDDAEHLDQVRRFFLEPRETYSAAELAAVWRVSPDDVHDIYYDQLVESSRGGEAAGELRIEWQRAVGTTITYSLLRTFDIERSLGAEFSFARAERWKTIAVLVRIPRFVASTLALGPSMPPKPALAHRIEQIILEFLTSGHLIGNVVDEVPRQ